MEAIPSYTLGLTDPPFTCCWPRLGSYVLITTEGSLKKWDGSYSSAAVSRVYLSERLLAAVGNKPASYKKVANVAGINFQKMTIQNRPPRWEEILRLREALNEWSLKEPLTLGYQCQEAF